MADTYYDGASTGAQIDDSVQKGFITVDCGAVSSLPFTKSSANILSNHVVVGMDLGTPRAQADRWTFTTSNGSISISGTIYGSTTVKLYLARSAQTVS